MANPQVEDGHTDIANEIVEALSKINLSAYESRIIWALFRKTYGWHKKNDAISLSQFAKLTNILPQHVIRTVQQLEARKIIRVSRNGSKNVYEFQKNYDLWDSLLPIEVVPDKVVPIDVVPNNVVPDSVLPIRGTGTTNLGNQVLPNQVDTKETNTKETIQKKLEYYIQHIKLDDDFWEYYEKQKVKYPNIDHENELVLFKEWWEKKTKKILKSPKLAWNNWLNNAGRYKNGEDRGYTEQNTKGTNNTETNKFTKGKYGSIVQQ